MGKLLFIGLLVFILNIPFGYWRANVHKLSGQWFLAIHLAVIIVIGLRLISHIGFAWYTYLVLVSAFFLGQQVGGILLRQHSKKCPEHTSCLFVDLYKGC